ncbi:hypothetical protein L6452_13104 [Arctium lappa]|uniref:Uncharacterized protein n=1 Tax=Arctium lappa TaxID=4217 RepID=A0ACB9CHK0_ARCLA|nr:hypothetical protein L6452_13104 [Arctium lappa]
MKMKPMGSMNTLSPQVLGKLNKHQMSETNNNGNPMPSKDQEEAVIKKKYGGLLPKKNPLISKDHDRAFFDSADWALGKQGSQKSKGPLEALRPKLQPSPQQQSRSRRSAYAPAGEGEADGGNGNHNGSEEDNDEKADSKDEDQTPI